MKLSKLLAAVLIGSTFLVGCGSAKEETPPVNEVTDSDAVTGPSRVTDESQLIKALGKDGTWIVLLQNDISTSKDLVVEGDLQKPSNEDSSVMIAAGRKLALYNQNDKKEITARYTLTAPKLTVKSESTTIKGGTFKGDIYVESKNFTLVDAKVEGNIYFLNKEAKDTYKLEEGSSVTGVTEMK
ncbi:hypothetical protein ACQPU1_09135 [Clostridium paraputrificum]|uniref:hypothetical protein n=1 Tax=Clostridium paraputrificum TaxID=29363 RepID=UPI003D343DD0